MFPASILRIQFLSQTLHAKFDQFLSISRKKFLHESCFPMSLVTPVQISASLELYSMSYGLFSETCPVLASFVCTSYIIMKEAYFRKVFN